MKLGRFLKMIDAYTDVTTKVRIRREDGITPLVETRLITVGYESMPYEKLNVVEFGFHNSELHIIVK